MDAMGRFAALEWGRQAPIARYYTLRGVYSRPQGPDFIDLFDPDQVLRT